MGEQFVPYELALKLKELGFDEQCIAGYQMYGDNIKLMLPRKVPLLNINDLGYKNYNNQNKHVVKAPLWQQAFDWFVNKGFDMWVGRPQYGRRKYDIFICVISYFEEDKFIYLDPNVDYKTFNNARKGCLEKLIEIANEQRTKNS